MKTAKKEKVDIILTPRFIDLIERLSKIQPEVQAKVLDGMVDYFNGLTELGEYIEKRDDGHRLMGAEIVISEFTTPKKNDFYIVLKVLNKNAGKNTPTEQLTKDSMPIWYRNDLSN